jgi:hypothetical protein
MLVVSGAQPRTAAAQRRFLLKLQGRLFLCGNGFGLTPSDTTTPLILYSQLCFALKRKGVCLEVWVRHTLDLAQLLLEKFAENSSCSV